MSARPDVLIVGGGVIALAIADQLSSEGVAIRVVEADAVGSGASGAAAGMLAPLSEAELDSPLLRLGHDSLSLIAPLCARLREETGIDPEYEACGSLHVARRGQEAERLLERAGRIDGYLRDHPDVVSTDVETLDESALRIVGGSMSPEWTAGFFVPHEAHLRPPLFVRALEASARSHGARIDTGVRAHRLRVERGRVEGIESTVGRIDAGATVLATGAWTPSVLEASGISFADGVANQIEPVRGQILTLAAPLPPMNSIYRSSDVYLVPKRDGSLIVGATEERVGFDRRVTVEGVAWLLDHAREVFPELSDASFGRAWAGIRPMSADGLPIVGRDPVHEGLLLAAGHGRNGILLSPLTARIIADEVLGKKPPAGTHPLEPRVSRKMATGDLLDEPG